MAKLGDTRLCLLCGDGGTQAKGNRFTTVTTKTREGEGLWIRCERCGLVINRGGITPAQQREFYNRAYVTANSYERGTMQSPQAHFDARLESIQPIADSIAPFLSSSMRVLEIGAATGELLHLLRGKAGYFYALEIIEEYTAFIRDHLGFDAGSVDYLERSFTAPFDFVIAVNTLDHLADPKSVLRKIHADLSAGGHVYIECPNDSQALKTCLPEPQRSHFAAFMYQQAHNYSFTFDTLGKLMELCGFRIVQQQSRHDYTLLNYLNWYFRATPQASFNIATTRVHIHDETTQFGIRINALLRGADAEFRAIMRETGSGESLCVLAQKA